MNGRTFTLTLALGLCVSGMPPAGEAGPASSKSGPGGRGIERITKSDEEWKKQLTPEQYRVLRREGTEMAFTGKYWNHHAAGIYRCAGCGLELFSSDTKFDSHCGWPSFTEPVAAKTVDLTTDYSHGMVRTEVTCKRCGGHLGHVFDDGPLPLGTRYCINSLSLKLDPSES